MGVGQLGTGCSIKNAPNLEPNLESSFPSIEIFFQTVWSKWKVDLPSFQMYEVWFMLPMKKGSKFIRTKKGFFRNYQWLNLSFSPLLDSSHFFIYHIGIGNTMLWNPFSVPKFKIINKLDKELIAFDDDSSLNFLL